jgi:hypothetical protein
VTRKVRLGRGAWYMGLIALALASLVAIVVDDGPNRPLRLGVGVANVLLGVSLYVLYLQRTRDRRR